MERPAAGRTLVVVVFVLHLLTDRSGLSAKARRASGRSVRSDQALSDTAIDHMNIAVRDLVAARVPFERMGFTIKPGRPHENGIANLHMKFVDGSEIELITATRPRDALAREYLDLVARGDGGAFMCLQVSKLDRLVSSLRAHGRTLSVRSLPGCRTLTMPNGGETFPLWFIEMPRLRPDKAEFTTHANGAVGLDAVWLSNNWRASLENVLGVAGVHGREAPTPGAGQSAVQLVNGSLEFVDEAPGKNGRPIVGVTVRTRSLEAARRLLSRRGIPTRESRVGHSSRVIVSPDTTKTIWVGFVE